MRRTASAGAIQLLLFAAAAAAAAAGATVVSLRAALAQAERRWDADAALDVLERARALGPDVPGEEAADLELRAGLAAAEILRARFEATPEKERAAREKLGERIDAIAKDALVRLGSARESSERHRIEADLVATLIRSDFRAKKYDERFRAAVGRALTLDPHNARALVSEAKPFLFAPPKHGRDFRQGIALLDRALALNPSLESALLLRAFAREGLGDRAGARTDWQAALRLNPDCAPAREALEKPGG